ncbi:uncharacterized protein EKO05_0003233 [Ascochyta rabiei]|uniref:uncharacterized protein n=1 Tax=Didymella rabiei TaxID=5454 RepID=UPI0019022969|nr:uncharacterized protein EKO05_0003233 [Ascochyta rabiei]UPX12694.1 hypothetical protein EKO05_0003233 [Ascochyta rabiei]
MTKPRRQHGAMRQLGAINKILRPEPQAQHRNLISDPDSRSGAQYDRSQESRGRASKYRASHRQEGARQAEHNVSEQTQPRQPTKLQSRIKRDGENQHSSPAGRFSQSQHPRGAQPHLHSPEQERPRSSEGVQTKGPKPHEHNIKFLPRLEASTKDNNGSRMGSEKRKRSRVGVGDEGRRNQGSKRHQTVRPNALQLKQQIHCPTAVRSSSAIEPADASTIPTVKCSGRTVRKVHSQQPSPPSSNGTPKPECHPQDLKKITVVESRNTRPSKPGERLSGQRTPPVPKTVTALREGCKSIGVRGFELEGRLAVSEQAAKSPLSPNTRKIACQTQILDVTLAVSTPSCTTPQKTKRQRDGTDDAEPVYKRLRQARSSSPFSPLCAKNECPASVAEGIHRASPGVTKLPTKHRSSLQQPQARAVPFDELFAPVAPNPECDFKILDYDNESVPVLYSGLIDHSDSTKLLNCPPEELVFDALDAIEASLRPFSEYGWPTAIDLLGRTPSKESPTKVLNDVDLYLHKKDGKLYVATDLGLIITAEYLKLIDVPETQPVRFDGRIPPWAKVALRAREKRKVVQIFGRLRKIKKITAQGDLEATETKRKNPEATAEAAKKVEARETSQLHQMADENVEYEEILEAERPGGLPLPLGSSVIVYKVDNNDQWAYGRLCDSGQKGWFPISHTCPVDWSLDRFPRSSTGFLDKPLPMSQDPEEKDWNGLLDYIRRQGFPVGPTWKQTCAATASTAARTYAISKAIADLNTTRSCNADMSTPPELVTLEATKTPLKQPRPEVVQPAETHVVRSDDLPIEPLREVPTTVSTRTTLTTATDISKNGAQISASDDKATKRVGDASTKVILPRNTAQPAPRVSEASAQADNMSEAAQPVVAEVMTENATMLGKEEHEPASRTAAYQPEPQGRQEDGQSVSSASTRNPFTVSRCDPFARNDDIEYDWDDSDDEEL